jgi:hypothetical protein
MESKKTLTQKIKAWWQKTFHWIRTHKLLAASIALVLSLSTGVLVYAVFFDKPAEQPPAPTPKKAVKKPAPKPKYYSPLTGIELPSEADTKKPVTAVIIENSPDARPQSGMQEAEITYEAIAEGGITRFLNVYQQNKPGLIGPVRSLRPYFVDWLAPWNASIVHVGGSKRALDEVRNGSYRDVDQFFNPGSYWRSSDRYAPHNVYTSFEKLDALNVEKGYAQSEPKPFLHNDTTPAEAPSATSVQVTMSSGLYNSGWNYDAASNTYHRLQAGQPHTDREAGQITTRSLVVLKMTMEHVMEDGLRESYASNGSGEAVVFQDGTATEVNWHKSSGQEQLSLTTKDGQAFSLARGKVWISAIPVNKNGGVSWQ